MIGSGSAASAADGEQLIVDGRLRDARPSTACSTSPTPRPTSRSRCPACSASTANRDLGSMYDPGTLRHRDQPRVACTSSGPTSPRATPCCSSTGSRAPTRGCGRRTVTPERSVPHRARRSRSSSVRTRRTSCARGVGGNVPGANLSVTINGTRSVRSRPDRRRPRQPVEFVGAVPCGSALDRRDLEQRDGVLGQRLRHRRHHADPVRRVRAAVRAEPAERGTSTTATYTSTGATALSDPKWQALPAVTRGEHALRCAAPTGCTG